MKTVRLLVGGVWIAMLLATGAGADPATTVRVSVDSSGAQASARSLGATISAEGRFVAFTSYASNLVAGDTNGTTDVFVHDRQTSATTRVSLAGGGGQANGESFDAAIGGDGRFVAFTSYASNLVPGDTNGVADVFVYDRQTGATTRISVGSGGTQGNGSSSAPAVSPDGRFVAFESSATNLAGSDANGSARDVFVHDRQSGTTSRVSVGSSGTQANAYSFAPALSADGRFVSFTSYAWNLVAGDTNGTGDVFVRDRQTGVTSRVSVSSSGAQGFDVSGESALSADGRLVAFLSSAENLVAGDTNTYSDVFVRDRQAGTTTRVSVASGGAEANDESRRAAISAEGRFVAFSSLAANLAPGDTNGYFDVFVRDRQSGTTTKISAASGGTQANDYSSTVAISGDGLLIAFESAASNLVAGDTNNAVDIFVHGSAPVAAPPAIDTFSPGSGVPGTHVTLRGTGFSDLTAVAFNGAGAGFSIVSSTEIDATVPLGATSGPISVTTAGGSVSSQSSFTVTAPPVATTITGFSPTRGRVGTRVTLEGSGFTGAHAVRFNGRAASFTVDSDAQISTTVPSGATTGRITVQGPTGSATSSSTFFVRRW